MADTIKKYKRVANFTTVNNEYLQDVNISWKAKGLITYIMSLPQDWKLNLTDLRKRSTDGREATASTLTELIKAGYCRRSRVRSKKGTFSGCDYEVADTRVFVEDQPQTGNPFSDNPKMDKPNTVNPTLINTNSNKETYIQKTKGSNKTHYLNLNLNSNEERKQYIESRVRRAIERSGSGDPQPIF